MKLSFSTLGCPSWTLARVLETAGREGYDGVELRFIEDDDALWERPELVGAGLVETLARLRDAGLGISCVDTRSFFHHIDEAARARARDEAARSLELAARLGARGIRVFGDRVQPGADLETTSGWIAESLAALWQEARHAGVEVWIETHGDFARARDTVALLERAGASGPAVVWDPANAFERGEEPEEGLRVLEGRIGHVHLKDIKRPHQPVLVGQGDFPAARALSLLRAEGYDGWVSFEWEKKWHPDIEEPEIALPHFLRWASGELRRARRGEWEARPSGRPVLERGRMSVEVYPDRASLGRAAAEMVAARLRDLVVRAGRTAAIFASAPSQNELLMSLRADRSIPWDRITAFHLDEFVGLGADHPASFRRFLKDRLFDHVPVRAFHGLDGQARDLAGECGRYAALLKQERPDLVLLGIGENGHLAFIDPPACDFADPADVRVVELDAGCRAQQVHDGAFPRLGDVPPTALSLTVPYLMSVPRAVAVVPGPAKREAVRAALEAPVTTACPASILRRHPDATLFLDGDSAAGLEKP
jgi:glucosamine-6-phosphate deaminase